MFAHTLTVLPASWKEPQPQENLTTLMAFVTGYTGGNWVNRTWLQPRKLIIGMIVVLSAVSLVLIQISGQNYVISTPGCRKPTQLCHANLLKSYYVQSSEARSLGTQPDVGQAHQTCASGPVQGESPLNLSGLEKFVWKILKHFAILIHCWRIYQSPAAQSWFTVFQVCLMTHPLNQAWYWCGDVKPVKQRFYRVNAEG